MAASRVTRQKQQTAMYALGDVVAGPFQMELVQNAEALDDSATGFVLEVRVRARRCVVAVVVCDLYTLRTWNNPWSPRCTWWRATQHTWKHSRSQTGQRRSTRCCNSMRRGYYECSRRSRSRFTRAPASRKSRVSSSNSHLKVGGDKRERRLRVADVPKVEEEFAQGALCNALQAGRVGRVRRPDGRNEGAEV